ncbi:hypothetical protein, conserved [Leishmania lindenbergi]|uniref:C2 domain-containing protein n=1 Tax=Leishmania lindenbergi TaxID=651832 RepID=A0AAW3AG25_9TRYP
MPVVDVSVLSATRITGTSLRSSFCVYVRLQGQAIRTKLSNADRSGEVCFGERFRFQYHYETTNPVRNRLFVELWTKSLFSQSCVSVAWIEMGEQRFVRGEQLRVNLHGTFEGKSSTLTLVITPLDFGEHPSVAQQPIPVMYGMPVEGTPLELPSPYSSAAYTPNTCPTVLDPMSRQKHEGLQPQPQTFVPASLPPPLYSDLLLARQHQVSGGANGQGPGALLAPSQNAKRDHNVDHSKKSQQL